MARLELVRCRLAIQCRIGYFPDGRERHRTFSLQDIRPDASADALASVVRAIAPLLAYPITKVTIVKKYIMVPDAVIARPAPLAFRDQSTPETSSDVEAVFCPEWLAASSSRFAPRPDIFVLITVLAWPHTTVSRLRAPPSRI